MFVVAGFDLIGGGNKTNAATIFIPLKPWDERKDDAPRTWRKYVFAEGAKHRRRARARVQSRRRSAASARAGGFEVYLQDRADADPQKLNQTSAAVPRRAAQAAGAHRHHIVLPADGRRSSSSTSIARRRSRSACREGRVRRAAEHDGRALRQRLQQVRPHVSRAAPGRGRVSRRSRKISATSTSARRGGDMIPVKALISVKNDRRPRADRSLQRLPRGQGARQRAAGVSSGQAIAAVEEVAQIAAARLHDRLDRAGVPGKAHRHRSRSSRSRSRSSWCS